MPALRLRLIPYVVASALIGSPALLASAERAVQQKAKEDVDEQPKPTCNLDTQIPDEKERGAIVNADFFGKLGLTCSGNNDKIGERCSFACAEGYEGKEQTAVCVEKANELAVVKSCSALSSYSCLRSRQDTKDGPPCCTVRGRCTPKGTVPAGTPEKDIECAATTKGMWTNLPGCVAKCPNIFLEHAKTNRLVGAEECSGLKEGGECVLKCQDGTLSTHSPFKSVLPMKCYVNHEGKLGFHRPVPYCAPVCQLPKIRNADQGVFTFRDCDICFPEGSKGAGKCKCRAECNIGTRQTSGSSTNELVCKEQDGKAFFTNNLKCKHLCAPPDSQGGRLDLSNCRKRCTAEDTECECELKCVDGFKPHPQGAKPGKFTCKSVWANEDHPTSVVGMWHRKSEHCKEHNVGRECTDHPVCTDVLEVELVDAKDRTPIAGAKIMLTDLEGMEDSEAETEMVGNSGKKAIASFATTLPLFKLEAVKDGYIIGYDRVDRSRRCAKFGPCTVLMTMIKKEAKGDLYQADNIVWVTLDKNKPEWDMQATLVWNDLVTDLDLTVRMWECTEQIAKRFECDGAFDAKCAGNLEKLVDWRMSGDPGKVAEWEKDSCRFKKVTTSSIESADGSTASFASSTNFKEDGITPRFANGQNNPYPKWIDFQRRYVTNLHKKIEKGVQWDGVAKQVKPMVELKTTSGTPVPGWNQDHWMLLTVDARNTQGPETVQFKNVPPGTYQVWVQHPVANGLPLSKADAHVWITLGNTGVRVLCSRPAQCMDSADSEEQNRLWHVADIVFGETIRQKDDKLEYSLRIEDRAEILHREKLVRRQDQRGYPEAHWSCEDSGCIIKETINGQEFHVPGFVPDSSSQLGGGYRAGSFAEACAGRCEVVESGEDFSWLLGTGEGGDIDESSAMKVPGKSLQTASRHRDSAAGSAEGPKKQ